MRCKVNGEWVDLEARTVMDVLQHYGVAQRPVVVEADGAIVDRDQWGNTAVEEAMVLEIVQLVSGG